MKLTSLCTLLLLPFILSAQDSKTICNQYSVYKYYDTTFHPSHYNIRFTLQEYSVWNKKAKRGHKWERVSVDSLKAMLVSQLNSIGFKNEGLIIYQISSKVNQYDPLNNGLDPNHNYFFELKGVSEDTLIHIVKNIRFKGLINTSATGVISKDLINRTSNYFQQKAIEDVTKNIEDIHDKSLKMKLLCAAVFPYEKNPGAFTYINNNFIPLNDQPYAFTVTVTYLIQ